MLADVQGVGVSLPLLAKNIELQSFQVVMKLPAEHINLDFNNFG